MNKYLISVKSNVNEYEQVPVTLIAKEPLSETTMEFIKSMDYNEAYTY